MASPNGTTAVNERTPIVYIQPGHVAPREPGYMAQTGATGEIQWTTSVAKRVAAKLRRVGVDARLTPGRVRPNPARSHVFVSIHYDTSNGRAAVGHAISGAGENYYHGEGWGTPSSTPYWDSAPHRRATRVRREVHGESRRLAIRLARRYNRFFTYRNGARSGPVRLVGAKGNRRMTRYYGFYRTTAPARVIIECGAVGTDRLILRRRDAIAAMIARATVAHLRLEGRMAPAA